MFRCDICDQEFKNEASYQKHLLTSKHITNKTIHDLKHQIEEMEIKSKVKKAPEGYKVLKEGQANILYIEQKLERDSEGFIKA